ncbi:MAG: glycoside hydrolase domain-containing protein [Planctomycetota bacterium]
MNSRAARFACSSVHFLFGILLLACCSAFGETVVLQEGNQGYSGCRAATLWGGKAQKPAQPDTATLNLRGTNNNLLIRFEIPEALRQKKLAQARLEVFVPAANKLRMVAETTCREVLEPWGPEADWANASAGQPWKEPGGTCDRTSDCGRGRGPGVLDSYELWEFNGQYFPHKYKFLGVPEGGKWMVFNVTPAAKKWFAGPAANNGVALLAIGQADTRFPNTVEIDIPSAQHADKDKRPRLVLDLAPLDKPYLVGMTHTLERICDQSTRFSFSGPFEESYKLCLARNEFEGFQAVIYPLLEPLQEVCFEVSDLVDAKSGAKIPKEDITYHCEEMFQLAANPKVKDWYFHGKNFVLPDPLVWDKPLDCPLQMSTPFWFVVHTKPETPAGTYAGTITVKAKNAPPRELRLTVRVWNYKIPEQWDFETMGQTCWDEIRKYYGQLTPELRRKYVDFLLDHRFTPTEQYIDTLSPALEDIPYCLKRGAQTIYLSGNYTGKPDKLKERYDKIKELGLIDKALVYIGDETNKWDEMRRRSDSIRKTCPELMIMIGGSYPRPELDGVIDIFDPQIEHQAGKGHTFAISAAETPAMTQRCREKGEKFFWYVAAGPMLPCPNVQMEDPLIASRALFWLTWKFGVTGFEYYCYNIWKFNQPKNGKKWPETPHSPGAFGSSMVYNGDGNLFYPGPDGPFSSVRFENIRDGIEDWESHYVLRDYLETLEAKVQNDAALGGKTRELRARAQAVLQVPDEVTKKDFISWTWDPAVLLKARQDLGGTIEELTKFVTEDDMLATRKARKDEELKRQREMLRQRAAAAK